MTAIRPRANLRFLALATPSQDSTNLEQANRQRYGPNFAYSEFLIFPTYFGALKMAFILTVGYLLLACKLVRCNFVHIKLKLLIV